MIDEETEGRVGDKEKQHDGMRDLDQVVVAASEVELRLRERSHLNHDRRGDANYEQNRRRHQRFRQSDFLMDDVTDTEADDVEL